MNPKIKELAEKIATLSDAQRLEIAARFPVVTIAGHIISARNTVLLTLQYGESTPPTVVGGFRQWLEAGRCVRKGEKAAYILRPVARKKDDASEDHAEDKGAPSRFVPIPVFDVSQTDTI